MVGEKFYSNLLILTDSELKSCIRFSSNPFFNKRDEITTTLKLFKARKDDFKNLLLDEELIFKKIFGSKQTFSKKALIDHFYYCLLFFEQFVIQIEIQDSKEKQLKILQKFYSKRGAQKEADSINSKLIDLTNSKNISFNSYLTLYELHIDKFLNLVEHFSNDVFQNIEKAVDNLDKFYFIAKHHWTQELEVLSQTTNFEYKGRLMNEIQNEIITDEELSNKLLFKIYKITYALYNGDFSLESYFELKELVLSNLEKFESRTKKQVLMDLSNYIAYLYKTSSDLELLKESFVIQKIQAEHKTLLKNNILPEPNFASALRVAMYLKEFEWCEKFIDESKHYVENQNSVRKAQAELCYNTGKYDEALDLVNIIEMKKFTDQYELKNLYAKILFDQKKHDLLENHLKTYELFLRRNKEASDERIEMNLRFVLYLKRLNNNITNSKRIAKLKNDVELDLSFFNRHWLLGEINKHV